MGESGKGGTEGKEALLERSSTRQWQWDEKLINEWRNTTDRERSVLRGEERVSGIL